MFDLLIRGGTVVDGSGGAPQTADVAVTDGKIVAVGHDLGRATRTLDADGLLVTPGFVDIHTHYDAQITWDAHLLPTGNHGVTTAIFGNCGVGFAPARPGDEAHQFLIELMEGVEDIPGAALAEGIQWDWESFPEYLDAVDRAAKALDVGAQVPHASVRTYVMGERGANNEPATPEDIAAMAALVREGIQAGALGFSTSRTIAHKALNGEPVPGTFAAEDELFGIGRVLGELGAGVFEVAGAGAAGEDVVAPVKEIEWMKRLSKEIDRPVSFAMLQVDTAPDLWREQLELSKQAAAEGAKLVPQVAGRPFGMLMGLQSDFHAFSGMPTYRELLALPLAERVARMRDPEIKRRILSEDRIMDHWMSGIGSVPSTVFPMGNPPYYEPTNDDTIEAVAKRAGRDPFDLLYDLMLEDDGKAMFLLPALNYSERTCDPIYEMIHHPNAVLGLGDGGAHCGIICDASIPTFMLTHWVRDRTRGPRIPVELVVKRMTQDTAELYGLHDRGRLAPGYKADLNLIDLENLTLHSPEMVHDLPAGGRRLMQRASGYVATLLSGEVTLEHGKPTEARPGRLVRGEQTLG
jgi:N-acyl-D-aspartate/D-glutamate deacylase